jgi:hypothetical protein
MLQASEFKAPPAPAPQANQPGEFTRMIRTTLPPQKSSSGPPSIPPGGRIAGPNEPGEFTRMMQSPAGPMPMNPVLNQPLRPQAPGTSGPNRVGEFTQVFGKGDIPAPPPAAAPLTPGAPTSATGAFNVPRPPTQPMAPPPPPNLFAAPQQPPMVAVPVPESFSPLAAPAQIPNPAQGFNPQAFAQQAPPPPQIMQAPTGMPMPGQIPGMGAAPVPPKAGDFTQAFSAPAQLTLGQAPQAAPPKMGGIPQAALPPVPKGPSKLPLYIAAGAGALAIVLLIVLLIARK